MEKMKQYLKFFLYIMMAFLSAGQGFAQDEIRVVSPSLFTIPIALTQETEIALHTTRQCLKSQKLP
ncbi:MAG: hypothetical protein BWK80_49360 [Desulfobacteraceae bacterium IS3]|nr:MAG: hypothetical protein BWK80_49360 [Desulfobacteraceae bacterium IS3]